MSNAGFECRSQGEVAILLSSKVCVGKVTKSFMKLFLLGILAGVFIGFGAEFATIVTHDLSKYLGVGFAKLTGGIVFSVGLILVVIAGAELFTGNNLIFLSYLDGKVNTAGLLRNWIIVYIANFVGSLFLVILIFYSGLWKTNNYLAGAYALKIATGKVNLSFLEAFTRAILCNWLVCLAVWMAIASRNVIGRIFAIVFPISAFVASGFEHSIANMFFIPKGIFLKSVDQVVKVSGISAERLANLNWGGFFIKNLIPVTLGNIIGGAIFVGFVYWYIFLKAEKNKE